MIFLDISGHNVLIIYNENVDLSILSTPFNVVFFSPHTIARQNKMLKMRRGFVFGSMMYLSSIPALLKMIVFQRGGYSQFR